MSEVDLGQQQAERNVPVPGNNGPHPSSNAMTLSNQISIPRASWTPSSPPNSFQSGTSSLVISPQSLNSPKLSKLPPLSSTKLQFADWSARSSQGYSELNYIDQKIDDAVEQEVLKPTVSHAADNSLRMTITSKVDDQQREGGSSTTIITPAMDNNRGSNDCNDRNNGQVLSRRSLIQGSRGVSIAETSMKTWVIQPGFMVTHWENLQHVGLTLLGAITLMAAIIAMFYTAAYDSLVSPHLKYGNWENKVLYGLVQTSYANPFYIESTCETPISPAVDGANSGQTCLALEHAGEAYHNYIAYMNTWAEINNAGEGNSSNISQHPQATEMIFGNTTVTGSWVSTNTSNMTLAYHQHGRIINNVTMSMPHAGIFAAAHDTKNGIMQPADLAGVGKYMLLASVVSPTVNVLCINMNEAELTPLIYTTWPHAQTVDGLIPGQKMAWAGYEDEIQVPKGGFLNSTIVDDLFEWGPKYQRQPPVFPQYPIDYNSIANISVPSCDSIYILFKSPTPAYSVCQMRSYLSPHCSTQYIVSGTAGGHLTSHCEDPKDHMAYSKSVLDAPVTWNTDWGNIAQEWALALSLNDGVSDANSSISRFLTQLVPTVPGWGQVKFNPLLPSVAEALAVLSGSTLLLSTTSASFYHYWEYPSATLNPGTYQQFNASISSQQYTSGSTQPWQDTFYIVLILVFLMNIFCLGYFLTRGGLVTDFTGTQNLFGLAVQSPLSERLSGNWGSEPQKAHLDVDWHVSKDHHSGHYYLADNAGERRHGLGVGREIRRVVTWRKDQAGDGLGRMSNDSRLSSKRRSWF
ncbi:hypothetical protein B7463_g11925, partial [Scytalidium lignicola]